MRPADSAETAFQKARCASNPYLGDRQVTPGYALRSPRYPPLRTAAVLPTSRHQIKKARCASLFYLVAGGRFELPTNGL